MTPVQTPREIQLSKARAELAALQEEKRLADEVHEAAEQRYATALLKLDDALHALDATVAEAERGGRTIEVLVATGALSADGARDLQGFRATRRQ